jgi:hypothetical protein
MRRGSGLSIPTQDLGDAFLPPDVPEPASDSQSSSQGSVLQVDADSIPIDREHPHPIDAIYGRNDLDERILAAARALDHLRKSTTARSTQGSTISSLLSDFQAKSEYTLSIELPNESVPKDHRRVPLTSATSSEAELDEKVEDGVLLIAYVTGLQGGRGQERISVCSGFAVEGGEKLTQEEGKGRGALVVTCAHTVSVRYSLFSKGISLILWLQFAAARVRSYQAEERTIERCRAGLVDCTRHYPLWLHFPRLFSCLQPAYVGSHPTAARRRSFRCE